MEKRFTVVFDEVILHQLKKVGQNKQMRDLLAKMFDKLEMLGPDAGKLIDSHLFLYEIKNKRPPIRLYFKHSKSDKTIFIFEYELKTSEEKQRTTINRLQNALFRNRDPLG